MRIGMFGGGTVGGGVYEIIMDRLKREMGKTAVTISKICVRDLSKPRSFHVHEDCTTMVTDVNAILEDESIQMVVEVMGGTGLAWQVVRESLKKGKHVVTANKALIAKHLDEIQQLSLTHKAQFSYEAAVCGGIPIIHTLQSCYAGDIIHQVMGICNGTTNYMLGKMECGAEYEDVLKEAQDLGYAEADPTADVEGYDVQAKIAILAKLAFGKTVPVNDIPCMGISQLTSVDFEYAKLLGCTIKLVGTATRMSEYGEHDGPLSVYVAPKVVPLSHLLASARGSGNAVAIQSSNLGIASYTGPGAGRFPTASSVVADICRTVSSVSTNSIQNPFPLSNNNGLKLIGDYCSEFYIRISFCDGLGIIRRIGELAETHGVSIDSILQNPIQDKLMADFVVTTEECSLSQIQALCHDISMQDFVRCDPLFMPMLRNK